MFQWLERFKPKPKQTTAEPAVPKQYDSELSSSMEQNIAMLDNLFRDVDIMLSRRFENAADNRLKFCIFFSDGVSDSATINEHLIKPLILSETLQPGPDLFRQIRDHAVMINDIQETGDVKDIIGAITYGDTLLLVEGCSQALLFSSKKFDLRSISEPEGEKVLTGPREGFNEGIMTNLSMVRRRLRTHELKLRFQTLGRHTQTSICIAYMDNIVNKQILKELYRRLEDIDIDGILDANYITEYITEKSAMGINTIGSTERPDVVASKLLEGRIAIFVDGTPVVLTLPYLFIENFLSNEDYYIGPLYDSYGRILRIVCFFLTIIIPGLYIAITCYHHEILPSSLMLNFANSRQSVPLPAALECFVMLVVFDVLRETGVRMPGHVGQALSIVGALVIGQAAVEAKLVAAPMIIVVAFSGITILLVPRLTTAGLLVRYGCLVLASMLGLTGLMVGCAVFLIHIINLQSFGVPCLLPTEKLYFQEVKDTFIRAPWPKMLTRLSPMTSNTTRAKPQKEAPGERGGK